MTTWRALKIIITPSWRPIVQLLAVPTVLLSSCIIVIAIGLLGDVDLARDPGRLQFVLATLQLKAFGEAVEAYKADCGKYPGKLERLVVDDGIAGWRGPYVKKVPLDPWGRPYVYFRSGDAVSPDIVSYGADGKPGGRERDTDLSSRAPPSIPRSPRETQAKWVEVGIWIGAWLVLGGAVFALRATARGRDSKSG